jgi:predicted DNA-binding WGR domain protein
VSQSNLARPSAPESLAGEFINIPILVTSNIRSFTPMVLGRGDDNDLIYIRDRYIAFKDSPVKSELCNVIILTLISFACSTEQTGMTNNSNNMLKLYKLIDHKLHYWETWDKDSETAIIHWGIVGQRGEDKEVSSESGSSFHAVVQKEIVEKQKEGYAEFDEDKIAFLEIEYKVDGFGTEKDLEKRYALENHLDELLGWTGLGHVDGGSIGSGSMEVGCAVVDFEIAKKVIEDNLVSTEFVGYTRIFRMGDE